jgi:hypothetical protein
MNENQIQVFAEHIAAHKGNAYKYRLWKRDREADLQRELDTADDSENVEYRMLLEKEIHEMRVHCDAEMKRYREFAGVTYSVAKDLGLDLKELDEAIEELYAIEKDEASNPKEFIIGNVRP